MAARLRHKFLDGHVISEQAAQFSTFERIPK